MINTTFAVILTNPTLPPPEQLAVLLAAHGKIPLIDARQQARKAGGFLGESLSEDDARSLSRAAAEQGLGTRVIPTDSIPALPEPALVHTGRAAPEGFYYTVGSEPDEQSAPWGDIHLVGALAVQEAFTVTKTVKEGPSAGERAVKMGLTLMTGIPMGMGRAKEVQKRVQSSELLFYMDILLKGRRLHMDGQKFNYAALGNRRGTQGLGNFKLILQDVIRGAPDALKNKGAHVFLSDQPLNTMGYKNQQDYEKEMTWLWTLKGLIG
jgi:hypothetical protein